MAEAKAEGQAGNPEAGEGQEDGPGDAREPDYYVFDDGDEKPLIRRRGELDEGGDWEPLWLRPVAAESNLAVAGWAIVSDGPQGIDLNWDGVLYRDLAEAARSLLEAREAFWAVLGAVMVTRDELRDGGYTEAES